MINLLKVFKVEISRIYVHFIAKKSTIDEKFDYFSSNFTEVIIEEEKKRFLSLFTQYVYTLNIDDGIEHNCSQFNVLLPNTEIFDKYIEKYTTVFKLHGDVSFYLKNIENESIIFNKKEYIESIKKNGKMLAKLKEDFADKNIIYIGCSLDDEPDLLSIVAEAAKERLAESQAFYITRRDIDEEEQDLLEEYGITTIVKMVLKIKPCKRNNRQNSDHTKDAAKEGKNSAS